MASQREPATAQRGSPPVAAVQQEFLFVDSAKAKSSQQGRRNARAFVMRKVRKERQWSTSKYAARQRKSPENASPTTTGTPDLSTTPITSTPSPPIAFPGTEFFPLFDPSNLLVVKQELCSECQVLLCRPGQHLCPRCMLFQPPAPNEEPDNSLFDPFGTMPVDMNGDVSVLLEHFVTEMAPGIIAVDIRNTSHLMRSHWFGTAMSNQGFMHSLLSTIALHRHVVGRGRLETVLYHRAHAIASVNTSLDNPDLAAGISDANIGAVFNLLSVEETLASPFFGHLRPDGDNPDQRAIHLHGLLKMVELRGGLMAMESNRILQAFILWHATAHAVASFDTPYLPTTDLLSAARNMRHPPGYQPHICRHLLECCAIVQVQESLTTLVESALILIADLNAWFGDANSPLDPLGMQNFSCVLECMLLQWLRDREHMVCPLEGALCVALLIFTIRVTEAFNGPNHVHMLHFQASDRLEKALSATSCTNWRLCPDLLLWILAIGAISAEGSARHPWFVYQVSLACAEFEIPSAEALLDRLRLCGWVSFKLDKAVGHLWEHAVNLRLEPSFDTGTVGPLQGKVNSPDFTDWQNVDWSTLTSPAAETMFSPGGFMASPVDGSNGLFDSGNGFVFSHNSPFYIR
ncbi:hypothetical protein P171DRAFT_59596 [Karstenula rhodostoma CBS 690.94]|uniref:Transcription factor domain-containing protein n=1 Tax=Karstenula rhodostoma CBS 690.94 TaxID=1392251 RepID=A0A9P4PES0_9PLEO|nr:hypothetical protein P171DRAFT_59596 [Karstenula rhodostoma CBS 690.94]